MSDDENKNKWICSDCTYLNWDASRKCVICGNAGVNCHAHQQKIEDGVINDGIFNMSLSQSPKGSKKWPCLACTFLNWPKSPKCVQCGTRRNNSEQSDPKPSHSDIAVISNPTESVKMSKALQKWNCRFCTYENWPKSRICVMCQSDNGAAAVEKSASDNTDLLWLEACTAILNGNLYAFENYLLLDNNLDRKLSVQECRILNQHNIFKPGLTLIDLALKMGRDDFIDLCLAHNASRRNFMSNLTGNALEIADGNSGNISECPPQYLDENAPGSSCLSIQPVQQRMPCHASPDMAATIRAYLAETIRTRKGNFPCLVVPEHSTFWLPVEMDVILLHNRYRLMKELTDQHVMRELQDECVDEPQVINWWNGGNSHNRLIALWNRTAGDCLLDSVLQATWAILDVDNVLRNALAESMRAAQHIFYPRWRFYEYNQARAFNYTINEMQYRTDWQNLLHIACQPGEPLEQIHIFVLSHIIRRPIIVYGVKYINNHRNEPVGFAHFQGVYLPILWDKSYCSRNPIVLGYTRGHFSALVPSESNVPMLNYRHKTNRKSDQQIRGGAASHYAVPFNNTSPSLISADSALCGTSAPGGGTIAIAQSDTSACDLSDNLHVSSKKKLRLTNNNTVNQSSPQQASNCPVPIRSPSSSSPNPICLLPLFDINKQLLPIHFLSEEENRHCETLLRDWLDVAVTRRGFLMARVRCPRRHPLVNELIENWLYSDIFDIDENEDSKESDVVNPTAVQNEGMYYTETEGAMQQTNSQGNAPSTSIVDTLRRRKSVSPSTTITLPKNNSPRSQSPHTY